MKMNLVLSSTFFQIRMDSSIVKTEIEVEDNFVCFPDGVEAEQVDIKINPLDIGTSNTGEFYL